MKTGFRFNKSQFIGMDVDLEDLSQTKVTTIQDGEEIEYSLGEGGASGSFEIDFRTFPNTMAAGQTAQIVFTTSGGAELEFHSNASVSKISVDINGLLTCIGNSTGTCIITIDAKNSNGDVIGTMKKKINVVEV